MYSAELIIPIKLTPKHARARTRIERYYLGRNGVAFNKTYSTKSTPGLKAKSRTNPKMPSVDKKFS